MLMCEPGIDHGVYENIVLFCSIKHVDVLFVMYSRIEISLQCLAGAHNHDVHSTFYLLLISISVQELKSSN